MSAGGALIRRTRMVWELTSTSSAQTPQFLNPIGTRASFLMGFSEMIGEVGAIVFTIGAAGSGIFADGSVVFANGSKGFGCGSFSLKTSWSAIKTKILALTTKLPKASFDEYFVPDSSAVSQYGHLTRPVHISTLYEILLT